MSKTPKRNSTSVLNTSGFSPVNLRENQVPNQRNFTGTSGVLRNIIGDIHSTIQSWNDQHIDGSKLVKDIAVLKSNNLNEYTLELEEKVNHLYPIVQNLRNCRDAMELLLGRVKALSNLEKSSDPVFITLNMPQILCIFNEIINAYTEELKMKEFVLESISHEKTKENVMFLATVWAYQCCITTVITMKVEALLIESDYRKIT